MAYLYCGGCHRGIDEPTLADKLIGEITCPNCPCIIDLLISDEDFKELVAELAEQVEAINKLLAKQTNGEL